MKKIVVLLSALTSSTVFAFAKQDHGVHTDSLVAKYEFAQVEGKNLKIYDVSLMTENQLVVEISHSKNRSKIVRTFPLTRPVAELLMSKTEVLVTAEIEEIENAVICMMLPPFGGSIDNLYITRAPISAPTLVDGPHGCWVSHKVYPKYEHEHRIAHELKSQLRALALQATSNR
ncbi:MAG: hypothetical protein A4S09_11620 [Proteobacteria bacterium SG_bin7]|nr:MAG: hypothetical protein A4S09_11620 [Proteobacteria bacterium SG_bin7]